MAMVWCKSRREHCLVILEITSYCTKDIADSLDIVLWRSWIYTEGKKPVTPSRNFESRSDDKVNNWAATQLKLYTKQLKLVPDTTFLNERFRGESLCQFFGLIFFFFFFSLCPALNLKLQFKICHRSKGINGTLMPLQLVKD